MRDEGYTYFLRMFSAEAQARHASSHWNSETRQVSSVEEEELVEFLSADDDLNLSDEPTMEREHSKTSATTNSNTPPNNAQVKFDVPQFTPTNFPSLNNNTDSVSTFHPNRTNSQQNRSFIRTPCQNYPIQHPRYLLWNPLFLTLTPSSKNHF